MIDKVLGLTQWAKSPKKTVWRSTFFKIQCHVAKNTILQTAFSAILSTGKPNRNDW